jgi:hypothetical protein
LLEKLVEAIAHIEERRRNNFQSGRLEHLKTGPHSINARHIKNSGFVSLRGFVEFHRLLREELW